MTGKTEVEVKLRVDDLAALRKRLARLKARPEAGGRVHEINYLFDTPQGGLAKHGQLLRIRVEAPERGAKAGKRAKSSDHGPKEAILTYKGPSERLSEGTGPRAHAEARATGAQAEARATGAGTQAEGGATGAQAETRATTLKPAGRYKVREEVEVSVADAEGLKTIFEALGLRGWFRYEKYRTTYQLPASLRWARDLEIVLDETPIGNFAELEGSPSAIDGAARLLGFEPGHYITKTYLQLYLEQCRKQGTPPTEMVFAAQKSTRK